MKADRHLTVGDLPPSSRRARSRHLRLQLICVTVACHLRASGSRYIAETPSSSLFFLSSVFPVVIAQLRRARAIAVVPSSRSNARHKLRLLLVLQLTPLEPSQFIRISRAPSSPSRPSAAPLSSTSPWPERSGAYLLLLSMVLSSLWYRVAR